MGLFIHSFSKYLFITCCLLSTLLRIWDTWVNKSRQYSRLTIRINAIRSKFCWVLEDNKCFEWRKRKELRVIWSVTQGKLEVATLNKLFQLSFTERWNLTDFKSGVEGSSVAIWGKCVHWWLGFSVMTMLTFGAS